jgi:hypothetical protein
LDLLQREDRLGFRMNAGYGLVVLKIFFSYWNASSRSPGQANTKRSCWSAGSKNVPQKLLVGRI